MYINDCPLWLRIGAPSSEGRGEDAWWTIPLLRDHLTAAALYRWLEAHDPQLGWPPDS
jgi:hypothetical protein